MIVKASEVCAFLDCDEVGIAYPVLLFYAPLESYAELDKKRQAHQPGYVRIPICYWHMQSMTVLDLMGKKETQESITQMFSRAGKHSPDYTRTELRFIPMTRAILGGTFLEAPSSPLGQAPPADPP